MNAQSASDTPSTPPGMRELKARSQRLKPMCHLGKDGITPAFLESLGRELDLHGLIKLKFEALKEDKKTLVPQIAEAVSARIVLFVGNTVTLYRATQKG